MSQANTILFTLLSGVAFTYASVHIFTPFEKFEMSKRSLALSLSGFVGVTILGYFVLDDFCNLIMDELKEVQVEIFSNNTIVLSTPKAGEFASLTKNINSTLKK